MDFAHMKTYDNIAILYCFLCLQVMCLAFFLYMAVIIFFTDVKDVYDYNTRYKNKYRSEIQKIENVISIGPKMWNDLPKEIRSLKHVSAFKSKLRSLLKN